MGVKIHSGENPVIAGVRFLIHSGKKWYTGMTQFENKNLEIVVFFSLAIPVSPEFEEKNLGFRRSGLEFHSGSGPAKIFFNFFCIFFFAGMTGMKFL